MLRMLFRLLSFRQLFRLLKELVLHSRGVTVEPTVIVKRTDRGYELYSRDEDELLGWATAREPSGAERAMDDVRGEATWVTVFDPEGELVEYNLITWGDRDKAAMVALPSALGFDVGEVLPSIREIEL